MNALRRAVPSSLIFASSLATALVPTAAWACPGARAASGCSLSGSSLGAYFLAIGVGLLAGAGSVALEGALKKRR